mmetsp:Transcript_7537/g.15227  ORF Transcript_7537/g.15227 Transcript_7537/m.15227 type:complete len:220 (+) Transcript_7537:65-724(+)
MPCAFHLKLFGAIAICASPFASAIRAPPWSKFLTRQEAAVREAMSNMHLWRSRGGDAAVGQAVGPVVDPREVRDNSDRSVTETPDPDHIVLQDAADMLLDPREAINRTWSHDCEIWETSVDRWRFDVYQGRDGRMVCIIGTQTLRHDWAEDKIRLTPFHEEHGFAGFKGEGPVSFLTGLSGNVSFVFRVVGDEIAMPCDIRYHRGTALHTSYLPICAYI